MQLHEIEFKPLELNDGWEFAQLPNKYKIWRSPEGYYSIELHLVPHAWHSILSKGDTLTAQCILHDLFK